MKMADMSVRKYSSASCGQSTTLRRISTARDKQKHVDRNGGGDCTHKPSGKVVLVVLEADLL